MKRLFSFLLIFGFSLAAFANVEIDFMTTIAFPKYQFEGHNKQAGSFPLGVETDFNFFFIPINKIDLGVNLGEGIEYF